MKYWAEEQEWAQEAEDLCRQLYQEMYSRYCETYDLPAEPDTTYLRDILDEGQSTGASDYSQEAADITAEIDHPYGVTDVEIALMYAVQGDPRAIIIMRDIYDLPPFV